MTSLLRFPWFWSLVQLVIFGLQYHAGGGRQSYPPSSNQNQGNTINGPLSRRFFYFPSSFAPPRSLSICLSFCSFESSKMGRLIASTLIIEVLLFAHCRPRAMGGSCWDLIVESNASWAQVGKISASNRDIKRFTKSQLAMIFSIFEI